MRKNLENRASFNNPETIFVLLCHLFDHVGLQTAAILYKLNKVTIFKLLQVFGFGSTLSFVFLPESFVKQAKFNKLDEIVAQWVVHSHIRSSQVPHFWIGFTKKTLVYYILNFSCAPTSFPSVFPRKDLEKRVFLVIPKYILIEFQIF